MKRNEASDILDAAIRRVMIEQKCGYLEAFAILQKTKTELFGGYLAVHHRPPRDDGQFQAKAAALDSTVQKVARRYMTDYLTALKMLRNSATFRDYQEAKNE